jgi:hypothetical protein
MRQAPESVGGKIMKLRLSARAAKVRAATLTGMAARPSRGLPAFWRALVRFLVRRGVQGRPDHHPPGALDASLCQEWMLNRGMKTPNCTQRTTQRQRDPPRHSRCWRPSLVFAAVLAGPQSDRSFGGLRRSSQNSRHFSEKPTSAPSMASGGASAVASTPSPGPTSPQSNPIARSPRRWSSGHGRRALIGVIFSQTIRQVEPQGPAEVARRLAGAIR